MRVVSPYGWPSGEKPICAISIESWVNSAAPTQIRMFVRSPAGLPASSRSSPIAPPSRVASSSLASTLSRNASASALIDWTISVGPAAAMTMSRSSFASRSGRQRRAPPERAVPSTHVEIAQVAGRGVRRRIAVADAPRLFLELRDRGLVGFGWCGEVPEDRTAALLARHGGRHSIVEEFLVAAGQTDQRHESAGTIIVCHALLALKMRAEPCKSHAARRRVRAAAGSTRNLR